MYNSGLYFAEMQLSMSLSCVLQKYIDAKIEKGKASKINMLTENKLNSKF